MKIVTKAVNDDAEYLTSFRIILNGEWTLQIEECNKKCIVLLLYHLLWSHVENSLYSSSSSKSILLLWMQGWKKNEMKIGNSLKFLFLLVIFSIETARSFQISFFHWIALQFSALLLHLLFLNVENLFYCMTLSLSLEGITWLKKLFFTLFSWDANGGCLPFVTRNFIIFFLNE